MTSHVTPKYGKHGAKFAQNFPAPNSYSRQAKQLQQKSCVKSDEDPDFNGI
jgi:hypothetical protein